jgi:signal peptidase II
MRVLIVTALIVLADQATKLAVKGFSLPWPGIRWEGMTYGESIPVLGDFFRLTYIENPGMAFGIDVGGKAFFSILSIVASAAILAYMVRVRSAPLGFRMSLATILGGAVGNLIDRVFYGVLYGEAPLFQGKVVDFFDVDFFNISIGSYHLTRWPVFNIADASVTVGVVLLLFFHRALEPAEDGAQRAAVAPVSGPGSPPQSSPGTSAGG